MEQRRDKPSSDGTAQAEPTRDEENTTLQQAQRRAAAEREEAPDADQVFDSANEGGIGPQGAGHGRRSGRHS
jgi:hypothetical protein